MAKRGETRPWRVTYQWDSGINGTIVCATEDQANFKADEIQRHADMQNRYVEINVFEVAERG